MKKMFATIITTAVASMLIATPAMAKSLTLASTLGDNTSIIQCAREMADTISEATGGEIDIQIFPDSTLGGQDEFIEGVQMGTVDMCIIAAGALEGFYDQYAVYSVPFLFNSTEAAYNFFMSEDGQAINEAFREQTGMHVFRERPDLALCGEARFSYLEPFHVDHEVHDNDVISLGNTKIRCVSCPGHTLGVLCFFMELEENGVKKTAALYGGIGTGTVCREFVEENDLWEYRDHFIESLEKVRHEKVDINLGNHTPQNDTYGKYQRMIENPDGPNPFIDPEEWEQFIQKAEDTYNRMIAEEG